VEGQVVGFDGLGESEINGPEGGDGSELSSTTFNYMIKEESLGSGKPTKSRVDLLGPAKGMARKNVQKISMLLELCEKIDCKKSNAYSGIRRAPQSAPVGNHSHRSPRSASDESVPSGAIFGMKGSHDWAFEGNTQGRPSSASSESSFVVDTKGQISSPVHTDPWPYGLPLPRRNPLSRRAHHPSGWNEEFVSGRTLSPNRGTKQTPSTGTRKAATAGTADFRQLMKQFSEQNVPLSGVADEGEAARSRRSSLDSADTSGKSQCPIVGVLIDIEDLSRTAYMMESRIVRAYIAHKNAANATRRGSVMLPPLQDPFQDAGWGRSGPHQSQSQSQLQSQSQSQSQLQTQPNGMVGPETSNVTGQGPIFKSDLTPIDETGSLNSRALTAQVLNSPPLGLINPRYNFEVSSAITLSPCY
jgi:hypothetical protein